MSKFKYKYAIDGKIKNPDKLNKINLNKKKSDLEDEENELDIPAEIQNKLKKYEDE